MFHSKQSPIIKGEGVNPDVGGFARIIINGKPYPAHVVAEAVETLTQCENDGIEHYPLNAVILRSHNGQHWTLRLSGTINGNSFDVEHYQPLEIAPERVAELASHYAAVGFIESLEHPTELSPASDYEMAEAPCEGSDILEPSIKFIIADDAELAKRDEEITRLEKVIEEFEEYRGNDWLELHDQIIVSERKVAILQQDNIRLANLGRGYNWLIGEFDAEEPSACA